MQRHAYDVIALDTKIENVIKSSFEASTKIDSCKRTETSSVHLTKNRHVLSENKS